MNDIDSHEIYKLGNDFEIEEKIKMNSYSQFKFMKEGHTIGNSIQTELLENENVIFSGYRIPHPLKKELYIKIKTKSSTEPKKELVRSIKSLQNKIKKIKESFKSSISKNKY
jgi:DNA-directed RNA polymerase II subunit RPB11